MRVPLAEYEDVQSSLSPFNDTRSYQPTKCVVKYGPTHTSKVCSKCGNLPLHSELSSLNQNVNKQLCGFK